MKRLLPVVLFLAAACGGREGTSVSENDKPNAAATASDAVTGTDIGSTLPEYSATSLDGSKFELASRRGTVALVNVWATWCGPCRYEIPELQTIHDRYAARGFAVIGVSVDEGAPETVREFVQEQKMTYPIVLDPQGRMASILQTSVLPTTVLLDRNGKIVWKKYGLIQVGDQELIKAIEAALG